MKVWRVVIDHKPEQPNDAFIEYAVARRSRVVGGWDAPEYETEDSVNEQWARYPRLPHRRWLTRASAERRRTWWAEYGIVAHLESAEVGEWTGVAS